VTLLPSSDFGIRGHPGKAYDVNEVCAVPGCDRLSQHAHHLWPRSFLRNQPQEWIQLPDGTIVGNRTGLCAPHHDDVSSPVGGHRARIVFSSGLFWWEERDRPEPWVAEHRERDGVVVWNRLGALDPQPPGAGQAEAKLVVAEVCPTCGHKKRQNGGRPKPARRTKEWTLVVPDDVEIGADVLDGWADDLAIVLGFEDETSRLRRYHAVATALAWTIQNRDDFVHDLILASR
jgi:hypothetical protein